MTDEAAPTVMDRSIHDSLFEGYGTVYLVQKSSNRGRSKSRLVAGSISGLAPAIFEKRYPQRKKNLLLHMLACFISGFNWLLFSPMIREIVILMEKDEKKKRNADNFILNYSLLAVYPVIFLPCIYMIEKV